MFISWIKNISFWRQALAVFAASMGMFNKADMGGWTNAANPQLRGNVTGFGMDDEGSSWVGSTVAIGGMIGSVFSGKLMDLIGRKKSLVAANALSLVGWVVIAWAPSVAVICVGRFLGGVAAASITLSSTVYVGEMVCKNLRGMFGSSLAFSISLGLQYVVVVGELTPGIGLLWFVPESPYYIAWKTGDVENARKSLNWILNNNQEEVEKTILDIKDYLITMGKNEVKKTNDEEEVNCDENQGGNSK